MRQSERGRGSVRGREPKDAATLVEAFKRLAATESNPRGTRYTASSSVQFDDDTIIKQDWLRKQGYKVKSWRSRLFVLSETGLTYFKDDESFGIGAPQGRIRFCDMISLSSDDVVAAPLPRGLYALLGLKYVFAVHSDTRTFVMAASSTKEQAAWIESINAAYVRFQKMFVRKNALMGELWRVGLDTQLTMFAKSLTKNGSSVPEVLSDINNYLLDQLALDVSQKRTALWLRKTFLAWKSFRAYQQAQNNKQAAPKPRDFFRKSLRRLTQRASLTKA